MKVNDHPVLFLCEGSGFGESADGVTAKIGPVDCEVGTISDTEIGCTTELVGDLFRIDNSGTHPNHGKHYAWQPSLLVVQVNLLKSICSVMQCTLFIFNYCTFIIIHVYFS